MSEDRDLKKSKYIRDGSEPESRYFKRKQPIVEPVPEDVEEEEDSLGEDGYRKSVITPKRARLKLEEEDARAQDEAVEAEPEEEILLDAEEILYGRETEPVEEEKIPVQGSGSSKEMFSKGKVSDEQRTYYKNETVKKTNRSEKSQAVLRRVVCLFVLTVTAVALQFLSFRLPFVPQLFTIEFSSFPELISSIAYGPLYGVLVCLIKNCIHILFNPDWAVSDFTNFLLDSSFVFIAGAIYARGMTVKNPRQKKHRRKRVLISSLIGAFISAIPQFFITRFVSYPLLEMRFSSFTMGGLVMEYQDCYQRILSHLPEAIANVMPGFTGAAKAIIIFNLPITFIKFSLVALLTALIYKYISPYLHYRRKDRKK
ncbi:MAG: ECF transporter S component [Eubacterium sp.]|nr:ECF transporter S component [Eubacterium sp.]